MLRSQGTRPPISSSVRSSGGFWMHATARYDMYMLCDMAGRSRYETGWTRNRHAELNVAQEWTTAAVD